LVVREQQLRLIGLDTSLG
jgi:hypothetical protein